MSTDIYAPPQATLIDEDNASEAAFYVVSRSKFLILYFSTLSLYGIYWFYRNWSIYRERSGEDMWPVARAIFSIFFAHSLFSRVDEEIKERQLTYDWSPTLLATLYVIVVVGSTITDRLSTMGIGGIAVDLFGLVAMVVTTVVLFRAQKAINTACGDPDGATNSGLGGANIAWIILGLIGWALVLFAIASVAGLIPPTAGV